MVMHRLRIKDLRTKLFIKATYNAIEHYLNSKGVDDPSRLRLKRRRNSHGRIKYLLEYGMMKSPSTPHKGKLPTWHYINFRVPNLDMSFKIFPRVVDIMLWNGQEISHEPATLMRDLLFLIDYPSFVYRSCIESNTTSRLLKLYNDLLQSNVMKKVFQRFS